MAQVMPYKRWRVPPNVPWPGRGGDDPLAAQLLRHAGDILARAPTHGPERHAASDRADLLLQQALGVNSSTSTVWSHLSTPPFNSSSLARPGCRDFRARRDELRAHLARLGVEPASARVDAGRGVQTAMQRALSRCINDGEPFRVVTLGCSMTEGQMSCFGRDPAGACWGGCVEYRWCSKLERNLARLLPCRVAVVCGKRGQGGSTYAFRFNEMVARHNPALVVSHLAHCDVYGGIESPEVRQSLAAAESVTRRALALGASFVHLQPAEPAFVHGRSLCSPPEGVRGLHLSLALRYRAPAISLPAAVCGSDPLLGPLRHWTGGCSPSAASCKAGIDRWGAKCWLHPGPHLHHIVTPRQRARAPTHTRTPAHETRIPTCTPRLSAVRSAAHGPRPGGGRRRVRPRRPAGSGRAGAAAGRQQGGARKVRDVLTQESDVARL